MQQYRKPTPIMPQTQTSELLELKSFGAALNVAIIGASGGVGGALADDLERCPAVSNVYRLSRFGPRVKHGKGTSLYLDLEQEESIAAAATDVATLTGALHIVIVATGVLHQRGGLQPEKTWSSLSGPALQTAFQLNTIGPALVAKHFLPLLARDRKSAFAALSARVGSIEDNQLGGWYAYRASKAALNMIIKTLSIELARRNPYALCVGLHPGTVDTFLSKPFQGRVPATRLFTPTLAARHLLTVLDHLSTDNSGNLYAWDGSQIPY